jgi:hypothetical protein
MQQVKVIIEGFGKFEVSIDYVNELMAWLSNKQAISLRENNKVQEVKNNQFTGRQLIEE